MITIRVTDKPAKPGTLGPQPKVVFTFEGTHDVSRIVHLLARGLTEHVALADQLVRRLRDEAGGTAALQLLAQHGGPDYTTSYPGGCDPEEGD